VERFDSQSAAYRSCLDGVLNDRTLSENTRRAALTASNESATRVGSLWDAYDQATTRFMDQQRAPQP
jgi:hypothetical protein